MTNSISPAETIGDDLIRRFGERRAIRDQAIPRHTDYASLHPGYDLGLHSPSLRPIYVIDAQCICSFAPRGVRDASRYQVFGLPC